MFQRLLPERLDNNYRGHKLALWLFALVVLMRTMMSLNTIFNSYQIAIDADGIPLPAYPTAAAQTIVAMFSLLGLLYLAICVLSVLALARYRSMVPLLYAVWLFLFVGGKLLSAAHPIARVGTPPGVYVTWGLFAVMLLGLALSFVTPKPAAAVVTVD